jgi:hypothetical protein
MSSLLPCLSWVVGFAHLFASGPDAVVARLLVIHGKVGGLQHSRATCLSQSFQVLFHYRLSS